MIKLGLIGEKLGHSFSKIFFEKMFLEKNISGSYDLIELASISDFQDLKDAGYNGFNVTIPYKESIIPFLDELSPEAAKIGAVNTILYQDGRWIGYNTDSYGFANSIKPFLNNQHERALIFGTGGSSKAVRFVLERIGIQVYTVSRQKGKGDFSYDEVNHYMLQACKMLVNCTPLGMHPDTLSAPAIPYEYLTKDHFAVDLIYNPSKTLFLQQAETQGSIILNGESMLREQALKSWEIWNNQN